MSSVHNTGETPADKRHVGITPGHEARPPLYSVSTDGVKPVWEWECIDNGHRFACDGFEPKDCPGCSGYIRRAGAPR